MKFWELFESNRADAQWELPIPIGNNRLVIRDGKTLDYLKGIFEFYLRKFKIKVMLKKKDYDTSKGNPCDGYIDLPFGVIPRRENYALCYDYINGKHIMYSPKKMNAIIVKLLLNHINDIHVIIVNREELTYKGNKFYKYAYQFNLKLPELYKLFSSKDIISDIINIKFDFRKNVKDWENADNIDARLTAVPARAHTIRIFKKDIDSIKLVALSIHEGNLSRHK